MKKRIILFSLLLLGLSGGIKTQITQLEFASGFNKTAFNLFSLKPSTLEARVLFSNLVLFQKFHSGVDQTFDEAWVRSTIYWNMLFSSQLFSNRKKFSDHSRSFIHIRASCDKQATQFAIAIDDTCYGEIPKSRTSDG